MFIKWMRITVIIVLTFFLGASFYLIQSALVDFSPLEHYDPGKPSILLDDKGNEWGRFALDRREPISFAEVPKKLIQAFVAAEDHQFFKHVGISCKGILRSALINLYYGRKVQGASTITQQLIKLLFFDSSKTFKRKIKEQFFALLLERQLSKEQIMQTYLNHVYFGCGIYGVQAASQRFWQKDVQELTLAQAATLAAIIKNPGHYCPLLYPLSAEKRRNIVLHSMTKLGFITQEEYETACAIPLQLTTKKDQQIASHLKETIRVFLEDLVGKKKLYSGGLKIQTTINMEIQQHSEKSFSEQIRHLRESKKPTIDGGLICLEVKTGQIKTLIGGYDFAVSKFNRALQARRQMGSIFKPIVYASAIENGMHFAQTQIDEPIEIIQHDTVWEPQNNTRKFEGEITLAKALARSNNIVTIKTFLAIGGEQVVSLAKKMRLKGLVQLYPSLALGCVDNSLKEVVGMFNVFANNGVYVEPHYIIWVKDEWGTKIYKQKQEKERVISARVSGQVAKVLRFVMERARKQAKKWIEQETIGKTGTTNESRTCWFAGSTPEYTTGIYMGCDNNESLGNNVYAASTAIPIWIEVQRHLGGKKTFSYDPSLLEVLIDGNTGEQVSRKTFSTIPIYI